MKIYSYGISVAAASVAALLLSGCGGKAAPITSTTVVSSTEPGSGGSGTGGSGTTGTGSGGSGNNGSGGSGTSGTGGSGSTGTGGSGSPGTGTSGSGSGGSGAPAPTDSYPAPVPTDATAVSGIQALSTWKDAYDTGTSGGSGNAGGAMDLVASPSVSGQAREYDTTYTNSGGERYYVSFGADTDSTNFFYDVWVYLPDDSTDIANLEFDMNQVLSNGQTVIYGFQCDGYAGTWDYTENAGTPEVPIDKWLHSTQACSPQKWTKETWHHVQVSYSRDDAGNVTYSSVWLDDAEQSINATVPSAFALGWGSTLLTNFQVDGLGAGGSSTAYLDSMTIYRW